MPPKGPDLQCTVAWAREKPLLWAATEVPWDSCFGHQQSLASTVSSPTVCGWTSSGGGVEHTLAFCFRVRDATQSPSPTLAGIGFLGIQMTTHKQACFLTHQIGRKNKTIPGGANIGFLGSFFCLMCLGFYTTEHKAGAQ